MADQFQIVISGSGYLIYNVPVSFKIGQIPLHLTTNFTEILCSTPVTSATGDQVLIFGVL